jgi:hypothetical protein
VLGRVLRYARKLVGLRARLAALRDGRPRPQIPASAAGGGLLVMLLSRLGSLNALERTACGPPARFWRKWLGRRRHDGAGV